MKNIKNFTQKEYDDYVTLELIPELTEDYGDFDTIILKNKKIHFAKTCQSCGDFVLIGKDYDLCKSFIDMETEVIKQYLGMITGLEVIDQDECLECECFESETIDDPETDDELDDFILEDEIDEDTEVDFDEDYGDGNFED
ncbi:hypothetical protein DW886_14715 [Enterocloster aldenensis]|uniref:hypothetical protein n=1 Tax=Enterocloster aldenensis TaxID=358742 RepID=UPI000E5322F3|nr:hypothetical protein DW886_14715 [Enterocloster aldenensis]